MENKQFSWLSHGLFFAILLSFVGCFIGLKWVYKGTPYAEVAWDYKQLYKEMIDAHTNPSDSVRFDDSLNKKRPGLEIRMQMLSDTQFYTGYWKNKVKIDVQRLRSDSSLTGRLEPNAGDTIGLIMNDSSLTPSLIRYQLTYRSRPANAEEFFARRPGFGIWALLIVAQLTIYFFLFPYALFLLFTTPKDPLYREWQIAGWLQRVIYLAFIMAALVIFYKTVLWSSVLVKPAYFMPALDSVLSFTNAVGYFVVAILLAAALSCIPDLSRFKTANTAADQQALEGIEKKANRIFVITAILLSLGILSTGALYNGMNSLPFIRQLNADLGFNIFSSDAPYLYGCIHSCILLVFFIPIRSQITSMRSQVAQNIASADAMAIPGASAAAPIDPGIIKKLTELLIAGSPFLVGLLQSILDFLFK